MKKLVIALAFTLIIPHILTSDSHSFIVRSEQESFRVMKLTDGLIHPWSLAILPDEEGILISERPGTLNLFRAGELYDINGLPEISPKGQGGLLDVIIDKDFESNRTIYFSYSQSSWGRYGTSVAKAELRGLELVNVRIIFKAGPRSRGGFHFGSRLLHTENGHLYITLGDRGTMENAQDLEHHGGSLIRINTDGSIPGDNPFIGRDDARPEIYSYGHRNAQGLAFNRERGEIWLHEHGPKGGDEVNIIRKGANYGWPLITYGINYNGSIISEETSRPGLEQPILYWVPSIAPSGMAFYDGELFPNWKGDLFVGALAGQHLRRVVLDGDQVVGQEILLKNKIGRIRDVRNGPDGSIYVLTDHQNGALYKIF